MLTRRQRPPDAEQHKQDGGDEQAEADERRRHAEHTHRVVAATYYRTFDARHPVLLRIKPGVVVETKTVDSSGRDLKGEQRHPESGNPLTVRNITSASADGDTTFGATPPAISPIV